MKASRAACARLKPSVAETDGLEREEMKEDISRYILQLYIQYIESI